MEAERNWLRVAEFAALYGLSLKYAYVLLSQKRLPAVKRPGLGWRISKRAFEREMEAGLTAGRKDN